MTCRAAGRDGYLEIAVSDRGRGIPSDRLETIFEPFEQVQASDALHKGGTGLGLSITRQIVEAHGGRITVDSQLGSGSTFRIRVPAGEMPDHG